jgi:alanine-glyoxylate transaminase/serine-glyoxylate transaminase/serine-pyruvate transaminase
MNPSRPLLMIPGPVEVSPAVLAAAAAAPMGHLEPRFVADFAAALGALRHVWRAAPDSAPFAVAGGGTLAMESAAANLVAAGERALVVSTGYFGDRMSEMLRRRGAEVTELGAAAGEAPRPEAVETAIERAVLDRRPYKALFATHVDTSTGVRIDPEPLARLAHRFEVLSVFDGVCATGGERFEMAAWDVDLYFTASQKAIGLPAGLALWVAGQRALAARRALAAPPPLALDWLAWQPVLEGYEHGTPQYFSTPPTTLVAALRVALDELLAEGGDAAAAMAAVWSRHRRAAAALRAGFSALGLTGVPARSELAAETLSALRYPAGVGNELIAAIRAEGVAVAGGLHRDLAGRSFRVGHMGHVTRDAEPLGRTLSAIARALAAGDPGPEREALAAFDAAWGAPPA